MGSSDGCSQRGNLWGAYKSALRKREKGLIWYERPHLLWSSVSSFGIWVVSPNAETSVNVNKWRIGELFHPTYSFYFRTLPLLVFKSFSGFCLRFISEFAVLHWRQLYSSLMIIISSHEFFFLSRQLAKSIQHFSWLLCYLFCIIWLMLF